MMRMKPERLLEFKVVAELRGVSMSSLLQQHITEIIREEKQRDPTGFLRALQKIKEAEQENERRKGKRSKKNKAPSPTEDSTGSPRPFPDISTADGYVSYDEDEEISTE